MLKQDGVGRKKGLTVVRCAMVLLLTVAVGSLYGCSNSSSAGDTRELLTSRQECLSVPNCVSVETELKQLKGTESVLHLVCPQDAPFLWNWDAERHRDVSITLEEDTPRSAVLHMVDNNPENVSSFKIFLGCSPNDLSERVVRFTHVSAGEQN